MHSQIDEITQFIKNVNNAFASIGKAITDQIEKIDIENVANAISTKINSYSEDMKLVLVLLGLREWFVSFDMPAVQIIKLKEYLINEENDKVDDFMSFYYSEHIEHVKENIIKHLQEDRKKLIQSAFSAHHRGEYELSIPTILSQADGICKEYTGIQLYSTDKRIPKVKRYFDQVETDIFLYSLLAPICAPMPINVSQKEREALSEDILNRHAILHGENMDYGTKTNSLKAIAYLNYVVSALLLVKSKIEP